MRFSHVLVNLVNLVGLVGLAVASPTPAKLDDPKRLVVFANGDFQGPSYEIDADNRCIKLETPVYKNLHSYNVVAQVCYFMGSDDCSDKALIMADARDADVWGRVDVGGGDSAGRIASVLCADKLITPLGDVRVCNSHMEPSCETVHALNKCATITDPFANDMDNITQAAWSRCYYCSDKNCIDKVLSVGTGEGDLNLSLGEDNRLGKRISSIRCIHNPTAEMLHHMESRDNTDASLQPKNEDGSTSDIPIDGVTVCEEELFQGTCSTFDAMNLCVALPQGSTWKHVRSLKQAKGAICDYYGDAWGCTHDLRETHDTAKKGYSNGRVVPDPVGITSVQCRPSAKTEGQDESHTSPVAAPESRSDTTKSLTTRQWGPYQGYVRVADQTYLKGNTWDVNIPAVDDNCAAVLQPVYWHIESLYQWQGSICTYWQWACGMSLVPGNMPIFTIDARGGDVRLDSLPDSFGESRHRVAWIRCLYGPAMNTFFDGLDTSNMTIVGGEHATVEITAISKYDTATTPQNYSLDTRTTAKKYPRFRRSSQLEVCHDVNMGGKCFWYDGIGCINNPYNVDAIRSFTLQKGYRCAMYQASNCQPTRGPPHYEDSRDGVYTINDVGYEIWSITCEASPY